MRVIVVPQNPLKKYHFKAYARSSQSWSAKMPQSVLNPDSHRTLSRSITHFFLGTMLSRITGFLREVALGTWMGATATLANFFIAYRFSHLLRKFFGESALLSSFTPHFETLRAQDEEKARNFFRDLLAGLTLLIILITVILEGGLFCLLSQVKESPDLYAALYLTAIMLPGAIFICLYALFSALLQAQKRYFITGLAPFLFNVTFIAVLFQIKDEPPLLGVEKLSWGVTFAFFVQFLFITCFTLPFLRKVNWRTVRVWTPDIRKAASAIGMTMVGAGAVQINSFIDTLFARVSESSGPAYLYYAARLYHLPIALVSLAIVSALTPPLARARSQNDPEKFLHLFQFAVQKNLIVMIPLTLLFLISGPSLVNFVYGRGAFNHEAVVSTTWCLWGYGIGLVPSTLALILAPAFYAKKDFLTPLKGSLLSFAFNIILNCYLIYGLQAGPASVAFTTTIAGTLNAAYLMIKLFREEGAFLSEESVSVVGKTLLCTLGAGLIVGVIDIFMNPGSFFALFNEVPQFFTHFSSQFFYLGFQGVLFVMCFLCFAWVGKVRPIFQMIGLK
ncbi:murein biosynthesis integral membrane protein MurJ [Rhabdochlamydiaceae symbiont of Dictyostelium giganteum]|uniref:murein biosynthesis integral membrane protein MurJ n=1 Tax=Rhabdochlamydiaceae symbiont of Dictyostelium giganteum TaxID=3342349 RepID=UPI00384DA885